MDHEYALTNERFSFLRSSSNFLNILLNNLNCSILILNKEMELQAFNNPMKTMFSYSDKDEELKKCGNVLGCAYAVDESAECGSSSKCNTCDLRIFALESYVKGETISKKRLSREYYTIHNKKVLKHLQYSTNIFLYRKEKYIILIIDDITDLVEKKKK